MKKYIQTKNLPTIFDISTDYFSQRMNKEFIEGIHYFIPPTKSKTKKVVLWSIEALENWIKNYQADDEVKALLDRR
ncbi:hypothetical protein [Sulfurimonas denitrificans]|nr:hypothetical protein [Sulfurimonas denitrificans]